tara:strand:- start:32322 stop:32570 length:249 start_codon:yes stop_codon:yes gene_type:complete
MERKVILSSTFTKQIKRLDNTVKTKFKKQILKIIKNPEVGKPLKYMRGERSLYVKPFRIIYTYRKEENEIVLLKFNHRKKVY